MSDYYFLKFDIGREIVYIEHLVCRLALSLRKNQIVSLIRSTLD